jgi:hypothetical protein
LCSIDLRFADKSYKFSHFQQKFKNLSHWYVPLKASLKRFKVVSGSGTNCSGPTTWQEWEYPIFQLLLYSNNNGHLLGLARVAAAKAVGLSQVNDIYVCFNCNIWATKSPYQRSKIEVVYTISTFVWLEMDEVMYCKGCRSISGKWHLRALIVISRQISRKSHYQRS